MVPEWRDQATHKPVCSTTSLYLHATVRVQGIWQIDWYPIYSYFGTYKNESTLKSISALGNTTDISAPLIHYSKCFYMMLGGGNDFFYCGTMIKYFYDFANRSLCHQDKRHFKIMEYFQWFIISSIYCGSKNKMTKVKCNSIFWIQRRDSLLIQGLTSSRQLNTLHNQ